MKLQKLIQEINTFCPPTLAYPWDNVGLLVGSVDKDIHKVCVALDVTCGVVEQAIHENADLILVHHPLIFKPLTRITNETTDGQIIIDLISNNIAVFVAHTNMDTVAGGINARLAQLFELSDVQIVDIHTDDKTAGLGRVGTLKSPIGLNEFCECVKEKLDTPFVRVSGEVCGDIRRIAFLSGSCSDYVKSAHDLGADVIVTGDLKYHECLEFTACGICVIDAGHFPTERLVVNIFDDLLKKFENEIDVCILDESDVYKIV